MTAQISNLAPHTDADWRELIPAIFPPIISLFLPLPGTTPVSEDTRKETEDPSPTDWTESLVRTTSRIYRTDPDVRLEHLPDVNPSLTEDHLNSIAVATEEWLNSDTRQRIRTIAQRHYDAEKNPSQLLKAVTDTRDQLRLFKIIMSARIPDPILAAIYANIAACETAISSYILHRHRRESKPDFTSIRQSQEDIDDDIRFASAQ